MENIRLISFIHLLFLILSNVSICFKHPISVRLYFSLSGIYLLYCVTYAEGKFCYKWLIVEIYDFCYQSSFRQSFVMCLVRGTSMGVGSLLEESLSISREMLREAQLAYPRNPVREHKPTVSLLFFK